jgi:hypothetical protein
MTPTSSKDASSAQPSLAEEAAPPEETTGGEAGRSALLDLLLNLAMLAVFGFLFVAAGNLPDSSWEPLGAWAFPSFVLGALLLLNLAVIVRHVPQATREFRAKRGHMTGVATSELVKHKLVLLVLALFGGYVAVFATVGYAVATFLFVVIAQVAIGPKTVRNIIASVIIALVASVGVEAFFARALSVFLPGGFF